VVSIPDLWLPILVASVLVFLVSSVVHMVINWHKSDYRPIRNEAETLEALRRADLSPGHYMFPYCESAKAMGTPEMQEKYRRGPIGHLIVMPTGAPSMGKFLTLWFLYSVLVSVFVAYIAGRTLSPGTDYLAVFRVAGATAFMAYGLNELVSPIWRGGRWGPTLKMVFDGLLYALFTAGAFGWLWPR
jgi:hypothetical protein